MKQNKKNYSNRIVNNFFLVFLISYLAQMSKYIQIIGMYIIKNY